MRNRDLVLDWLARIRVAGVEPLAKAIGISERRVRGHAERLEAEGLCVRHRMDDGEGAVLVATARGVRAAGYKANSRSTTSSRVGLLHGRGVSWVAAHCERCRRPWLGPAELRGDGWPIKLPPRPGSRRETHMPDLGFVLDGRERWAVEFERTAKGREPLEQILEGYREAQLRGERRRVLYVCADDYIAGRVESVAESVEVDRAVRTLDWVIAETRAELEAVA